MKNLIKSNKALYQFLSYKKPNAAAKILGGENFPNINGVVEFYALHNAVIVTFNIENLPETQTNIFAVHIHEGETCDNNFDDTGNHFNPENLKHPNHAGDLPPLFSFGGEAWCAFCTKMFTVNQILNKTIVIHSNVDNFTSQPAGNSGTKIACGSIRKFF